MRERIDRRMGSNIKNMGGENDIKKMLLKDEYLSDVNKSRMRRIMNVVCIKGSLIKEFKVDFNWYNLERWVKINEKWKFRK
jgi:hypothetical protein